MNKLTDFNSYILDKIFESVGKKETAIILSDRLYDLLLKIDHPISNELKKFNREYTYESDKVTLIDYDSENKSNFTYTIPVKLIDYIEKNYSHYNDNLNISRELIRVGKLVPEVWTKFRNSTGIGRVINKLFPDKYKPAGDPGNDLQSFTNTVILERTKDEEVFERFKIVEGDDINKYYLEKNYDKRARNGSTLGGSCMRHESTNKYMNFYSENKGVKLVILMSDNEEQEDKIMGRALLWDIEWIDHEKVDRKFMDRIYYIYESDMMLFKEYAKKNGWLYKNNQNMYSDEKIYDTLTNKTDYLSLITTSTFKPKGYYPYMDTMKYYYYDNDFLSNDDREGENHYFLESTSGNYTDRSGMYVEYYDDYYDEDDLTYCELGGEYRLTHDAIYIERYDEYATQEYVDRNMEFNDITDEYIDKDDAEWSDYHGTYIHRDDAVEVYEEGAAEEETIEDAIEYSTDYVMDSYLHEFIGYYSNAIGFVYFSKEDEDMFIKGKSLKTGNNIYIHKIWNKDKIFKYQGIVYLLDDEIKKDELIGQKRLWES